MGLPPYGLQLPQTSWGPPYECNFSVRSTIETRTSSQKGQEDGRKGC